MDAEADLLRQMLTEGWSIEGYSNTIMSAGAMTYSVLMRRNEHLVAVTVVVNGGKELGRTVVQLSPRPTEKSGWR